MQPGNNTNTINKISVMMIKLNPLITRTRFYGIDDNDDMMLMMAYNYNDARRRVVNLVLRCPECVCEFVGGVSNASPWGVERVYQASKQPPVCGRRHRR